MSDPAGRRNASRLRLVRDEPATAEDDQLPQDALQALLLAQHGYRAAADAADGVSLPSLTDFVD
jgi:hypothetical protein